MKTRHAIRDQSLVFIGFMVVGKTTVVQLVAQNLYRDFIDIDLAIQHEFEWYRTEIFQTYGEATFRKNEKEYVHYYCKQPLKVISLGGGAFMQEDIRDVCLNNAIVFYLDISW